MYTAICFFYLKKNYRLYFDKINNKTEDFAINIYLDFFKKKIIRLDVKIYNKQLQ